MRAGRVTGTVGVVGGGQLARMMVQAAIPLGIDVVVLCDDPRAPAVAAGARHCLGRTDHLPDLLQLAGACDVVTLDHERTPAALLAALAEQGHRVAPGARAAGLGQDKVAARSALASIGVAIAPWALVEDREGIFAFGARHGWPLVIKTPSGGYDGRGVWTATSPLGVDQVLRQAAAPLLVEPRLDFSHELSVMVVRSWTGETATYAPFETVQHDGQCHEVMLPARVPAALADEARHLAITVAEAVELVGAMAVELFVLDGALILNELAVRPHNSAHLTIEACETSQFENHLRAVLGLPLGATDATAPAAAMVNIVGPGDGSDPFTDMERALRVRGAHVHRYGKTPRADRKLGHVTATGTTLDAARATARRAADAIAAAPS